MSNIAVSIRYKTAESTKLSFDDIDSAMKAYDFYYESPFINEVVLLIDGYTKLINYLPPDFVQC